MDKPTILVIDDNLGFLKILSQALKRNFDVQTAHSILHAYEFLNLGNISAVLTDVHLPEGSGKVLVEALREQEFEIPIFVMTGDENISHHEVLSWGATTLFRKPFTMVALTLALHESIASLQSGRKSTMN